MTAPRPKILIVDDNHANLVAMHRLLGDCGAELIDASNGNDALALCLEHAFALILLDVNMPGMDGFEVAHWLDAADELRDIPIIFVTAAYDDVSRLKGYHAGAVDYIAKPINDVILRAKVRVFLDLHAARQQLQQVLAELSERNRQLQAEIAERRRAEALVRHQATHDTLTGLPNRMLFHERLQRAIAQSTNGGFALAMLDLDGFKAVNDQYGHPAGDALLRAVASRLRRHLRRDDTIARLGGDEFALIFASDARTALQRRCTQWCTALAEPYSLPGGVLARIGASIGVAIWRTEMSSGEDLMRRADAALYAAKHAGKNQCVLAGDAPDD